MRAPGSASRVPERGAGSAPAAGRSGMRSASSLAVGLARSAPSGARAKTFSAPAAPSRQSAPAAPPAAAETSTPWKVTSASISAAPTLFHIAPTVTSSVAPPATAKRETASAPGTRTAVERCSLCE